VATTTTKTSTTNFNQTVVALVHKRRQELLRAPLPHIDPANYLKAEFVKGTNNTMRFLNVPDLSVVAGTPTPGTPPWLTEAVTPDGEALAFGYEEFSANQAGRWVSLSDIAVLQSPLDLMREAADRVARNAIATADKRVAEVLITGTNVIYANGATSSVTFPIGSSPLTGALVKRAVALLQAGLVPTFGDGTYHAIVHPGAVFDLQSDTSVGGWIDAARYAGARALMTGEMGEYAGVRFIASASAGQKLAQVSTNNYGGTTTSVASSDIITTSTAHGLSAGMRIRFSALTGGSGLSTATNYYVIGSNLTSTTFMLSATLNGSTIDHTTNITAATWSQVYDVNSTHIFGPNSYVFGDWGSIEAYYTAPGGPGDELHQRSAIGWKGFFGAVIVGQGTSATNVSGPRYIRIESVNPIS
jgi:hypothetical protein